MFFQIYSNVFWHLRVKRFFFVSLQSGGDDGYYNCEEIPFFEIGSVHHEQYLVNIRLPAVDTNTKIGRVSEIHFVVSCNQVKLLSVHTITQVVISITKFSMVIAHPHAYFLHNWHVVT